MGHYRSEMVSEEDDRREAERRTRKRNATAARIKEGIESEGLEFVLADIVLSANKYSDECGNASAKYIRDE